MLKGLALKNALKEKDDIICRAAAGALGEIGSAGADAVPELIEIGRAHV